MAADVIIDIAKLKTHKKTGVTLCLKNMVGVNWPAQLPSPLLLWAADHGGDEFPPGEPWELESRADAIRLYKRVLAGAGAKAGTLATTLQTWRRARLRGHGSGVRSGNWFGNNTAWRMVLDVNKALVGFDAEGRRDSPLRMLCLVDGIVGGEGDGPSDPDAVIAGSWWAG